MIGCAASISQLGVYLATSAVILKKLYTELQNADSIYRNEASNIQLLLTIFQKLPEKKIEDHDPVLPVLIAISTLSTEVLGLLEPRRRFGINWAPIASRDKINSAFESLEKKRRLLHLYISQAHQTALIDLRHTIDQSNMANSSGGSAGSADKQTRSVTDYLCILLFKSDKNLVQDQESER